MSVAPSAIPPNPKRAAIRAIINKVMIILIILIGIS